MEIECVVDGRSTVGEGPVWDARDQRLWWVDIPEGLIHRFDPGTGRNESFDFGEPVGSVAVRESGGLVVASRSGFHEFDPESGRRKAIGDPESGMPDNRFNDGGTDRQGRFWAGTMRDRPPKRADGSFYRLDGNGDISRELTGFITSNGLAFSPDGNQMYVSDTGLGACRIWRYDYDGETGFPSNVEVYFDARDFDGRPDGGTVDCDGCYWMAAIDGWKIVRITPDGRVDKSIRLPIERPTKPMFGGPRLDTIYVTSLSVGLTPGSVQPHAGGLFAITGVGNTGVEEARFSG